MTRAALSEIVGSRITAVDYIGLDVMAPTTPWDYGAWHHPEVGVEVTTADGALFHIAWFPHAADVEVVVRAGPMAATWPPARTAHERRWSASTSPGWSRVLNTPIVEASAVSATGCAPGEPLGLRAVRLAFTEHAIWLIAGGPLQIDAAAQHGLESPAAGFMLGTDELVAVFDDDLARRLGLGHDA